MTYNNWKRWHQAQNGSAGNRAVVGLIDLLKGGTAAEKLATLRGEGGTVWLAVHPEGQITFLHHVHVHGGTRVQPVAEVLALVGDGPTAYPIRLPIEEAAKYQDVAAAPAWTNVVGLNDEAAVNAAPAGANSVSMPSLFPVPPHIADALLDEPDRLPWQLIRPLRSAITGYDNGKQANDPAMGTDAHVRLLPRWLWAAHRGHIAAVPLVPTAAPYAIAWARALHAQCITGPVGGPPAGGVAGAAAATAGGGAIAGGAGAGGGGAGGNLGTSTALVTAIVDLKEEVKTARLNREQSASKSKPGIESFPASVKKVLEFASQTVSRNGAVQGTIPASAKEFFSSSTAGHAGLCLQSFVLSSKYHVAANDKAGLGTRLHKGAMKWASNGVPANLSIFACSPESVMADSGAETAVSMGLAAAEGGGLTDDQQKALLKQDMSYPRSVHAATKQLKLFAAILLMLFGTSELQLFVDAWVDHITTNESAYDTMRAMDEKFFLRMFYFIDKAVQVFLDSCERQPSRDLVPDQLFECQSQKNMVLLHQCPFHMPEQFGDPAAPQDDGEDEPQKKKRKQPTKERIDNGNAVKTLLVNPISFEKKYGRKTEHYANRPSIRNTKFCVTYHLLGYCYQECELAASHVKLSPAEVTKVKGYAEKCVPAS